MLDDPLLLNDWHVAARCEDVPDLLPLAVTVLGEPIVLWRSSAGIHAWKDLCLHRGAKLSLGRVQDDCLVCPYHAWTYNGEGACVRIPAQPERAIPERARAFTLRAVQRFGWVWVCLGDPAAGPPDFPEWDDAGFRTVHCGPYRFQAHGPRAIENFLDVSHFPFVHDGLLGDPEHAWMEDYEARVDAGGLVADDIRIWQPDPDGRGQGVLARYDYRVLRHLVARFTKELDGGRFAIFFAVTPTAPERCDGWMIIAMDYPSPQTDAEIREFEDKVVAQDVPVVESQRPELLPLDLQAELNLRSDRLSIAYRQWLRTLGFRYGTA